jgi:hypothetical protein
MFVKSLLMSGALMFGACAASSTDGGDREQGTATTYDSAHSSSLVRLLGGPSVRPADEGTCTVVIDRACHVGQCELGPHDTVQSLTETCCTAAGVCTVEHYRECGC